ncbi:MAG: UbiD family decarboxylase, partial [Rhodospirillales bacterium]|nr:UbiD family decarboxylase [Rhodospirillales bacterium]
ISQFPPSESSMIKRILLEASLLKHVGQDLNIPGVVDIHALEAGGCTATLWVSIKKMYTGHVDQVVFGILGYFGMSYYKWIIVTDDAVDIRDPFMRDWIMAWHVQPDRDIRILANTAAVELDPSGYPPDENPDERLGGKVIIDATRKFDFPDLSLPPMQYMKRVVDSWDDYGLPPLDELKLPKNV